METLSTLPADFKGKNSTAEVKVHPSGKFVWVSNRGHDSLAGFAIDQKSGKLRSLGRDATEKTPRSFEITPDGRYVFGAVKAAASSPSTAWTPTPAAWNALARTMWGKPWRG